jgi:choline-sulfatase
MLRVLPARQPAGAAKPNILIVLFDAWSAPHLPIYGYARDTTPNLTRLAERAVVYHQHYSTANFTTPGTASLLTGVYPWTHRAFRWSKPMAEALTGRSMFHAIPSHHTIVYSHNPLVNALFDQFEQALDDYIPLNEMMLTNDGLIQRLFHGDDDVSSVSWMRTVKESQNGGYAYSLLLSNFYKGLQSRRTAHLEKFFPRGLPAIKADNYFVLEQAIDLLSAEVRRAPRPFLAYLHFMPPHYPYRTHGDFMNRFSGDGYRAPAKPFDIFGQPKYHRGLAGARTEYDEYILYVDREFDRFFRMLEETGMLQDTWLILTSDHGEMFERGIARHLGETLFQPVIRVPLLIFEPGRTNRLDIHAATSAVDILPTLMQITGSPVADWTEGVVLPPYGQARTSESSVFAVEATKNDPDEPLARATIAMVKGRYKLTYFMGYRELPGGERLELYNIQDDPEELHDLFESGAGMAAAMLDELKEKLNEVNRPFVTSAAADARRAAEVRWLTG